MLGSMYAAGRGTAADPAAAYTWLALAVLQGDSRAQARLDALGSQLTEAEVMESTVRARSLTQLVKPRVQQSLFH